MPNQRSTKRTSDRRGGSPPALHVRRSRPADLEMLVAHRRRMWAAIGGFTDAELRAADEPYRRWMRRELRARRFVGFVAEVDGRPVGSGGLWLMPVQPRPGRFSSPFLPYILSMFTDPAYRGRGVGSEIVRTMLRTIDRRGVRSRVTLHASDLGRPVYERLGFVPGREMYLDLKHGVPPRLLQPPRRAPARPRTGNR